MLKLSRFADYSIVLLTQMASRPPVLVQAPELALLTGLSVPTVAKTMKSLCTGGVSAVSEEVQRVVMRYYGTRQISLLPRS